MGKFGKQHRFKKAETLKRIEKEKQAELVKKSKISLQKTKLEFKQRYFKICKFKSIEPETAAKQLCANTIAEIREEFNLSIKEFGYAIRLFKSVHLTSFDPSFVSENYLLDKKYQLLFRIISVLMFIASVL